MIQRVKLHQGQILTKDNINQYLVRARNGCDYCRFEMKFGTYITIAFFKDMSYDIMTNNRSFELWSDIQNARRGRTINILTPYIFKWIRKYNA